MAQTIEALSRWRSHSFFLRQAGAWTMCRSKIMSLNFFNVLHGVAFHVARSTPLMGCCHRYVAWPGRPMLTMKHMCFFFVVVSKVPMFFGVFWDTTTVAENFTINGFAVDQVLDFVSIIFGGWKWSYFVAQLPATVWNSCHFLLERLP